MVYFMQLGGGMRTILDDVYLLESTRFVNVFVLGNPKEYCLVDAGMERTADALLSELEDAGFSIGNLTAVILTHSHPDHIGGLPRLLEVSIPKLYAHFADVPSIEQKLRENSKEKADVDIVLENGSLIDVLGGLEVISTPGHTPGCIALYQRQRKIMFFSDVIKVVEGIGLRVGQPEKYNNDTQQTMEDGQKLLGYEIESALLSHGDPLLKEDIHKLYALKRP